MKQFEITIPDTDNAEQSTLAAHARFRSFLASQFGGFTFWNAQGHWVDGAHHYRETVIIYRVAIPQTRLDPHSREGAIYSHPRYVEILQCARRLFADQLAFYWSLAGECEVTNATDI